MPHDADAMTDRERRKEPDGGLPPPGVAHRRSRWQDQTLEPGGPGSYEHRLPGEPGGTAGEAAPQESLSPSPPRERQAPAWQVLFPLGEDQDPVWPQGDNSAAGGDTPAARPRCPLALQQGQHVLGQLIGLGQHRGPRLLQDLRPGQGRGLRREVGILDA